jgi:glycosyltransferase involved in cell wall biosynthesis
MINPKVSICIPTYNEPEYLRKALYSVSSQDFKDYEVIITDDSPNNFSEKVALEFSDSIANLKYFKNSNTKGSPENWNEAVSKAVGVYIKILHTDDWFADKNSLGEYVKMLDENPGADFAFSASSNFFEGKLISIHQASPFQLFRLRRDYRSLYPNNFVGAPSSTIYRKSVGKEYDKRMKIVVDIDFYVQVLKDNRNFVYLNKPLVNITTGAAHQQTTLHQSTKQGGLLEWLYMYDKINDSLWFKIRTIKFLNFIFRNYKIQSQSDMEGFVPNSAAMRVFNTMFFIRKFFSKVGINL